MAPARKARIDADVVLAQFSAGMGAITVHD
jgi:hypothetical protein